MPVSISLGFSFKNGDSVTPSKLHSLVDEAYIGGFAISDFDFSQGNYLTYGSTRPDLTRGHVHYDTTAGLEGLYFSFLSASNGSVAGWLCSMPRHECYCWANSAISANTPCFLMQPGASEVDRAKYEVKVYDGSLFPRIYQYSGASGVMEGLFIALESCRADDVVKCMWMGLVPDTVALRGFTSDSGASCGSHFAINRAACDAALPGAATPLSWIFGVHTMDSPEGRGALIWNGSPVCADNG